MGVSQPRPILTPPTNVVAPPPLTRFQYIEEGEGARIATVDEFGAVGDGVTDDSAAFNAAKTAAGVGGTVLMSAGKTYLIGDFDLLDKQTLVGGGAGTVVKAVAGATFVVGLTGIWFCQLWGFSIDGNATAIGLRIRGMNSAGGSTSQRHLTEHVWVSNCTVGIQVDGPAGAPPVDQVDKNTYVDTWVTGCDVGLFINSANGQEQCFIGGSIDDCTTVHIRMGGGTMSWLGGQAQQTVVNTGKLMEFTTGNVDWVKWVDVITEGHTVGFDSVAGFWPANGVNLDSCVIEGYTTIASVSRGGSIAGFVTRNCRLARGVVDLLGNDTFWRKEDTSLITGATFTQTGGNTKLYESPPIWQEIGAAGKPAFANAWQNFGAGNETAAYMMDGEGVVHLKGMISAGVVGSAAFTLPSGYRPALYAAFSTISNGVFGQVSVSNAGVVTPQAPSNNANVSLNGISFRAP